MPVNVFNPKTKETLQFDAGEEEQLRDAINAGFQVKGVTNLVDQTGDVKGFKPEDVVRALNSGAFIETRGSQAFRNVAAARRERFTEPLERIQAFGEAGVRGLTVGTVNLGGREAQFRREFNPRISLAGELIGGSAGVVGGTLGTGTSRLIGATPAGLVGRAARGASTRLGRGPVSTLAVEGAIEGGFFGAGQAISDAVLTDKPLTVEAVVSGAATGTFFGGAIGGGIGFASRLTRKARVLDDLADQSVPLSNTLREADNIAREALENIDDVVTRRVALATDELEEAARAEGRAEAAAARAEAGTVDILPPRAPQQLELDLPAQQRLPLDTPEGPAVRGAGRAGRRREARAAADLARRQAQIPPAVRGEQLDLPLGGTPPRQLDLLPQEQLVGRRPPPVPESVAGPQLQPGRQEARAQQALRGVQADAKSLRKIYSDARKGVVEKLGGNLDIDLADLIRREPQEALEVVRRLGVLEDALRQVDDFTGAGIGEHLKDSSALLSRLSDELPGLVPSGLATAALDTAAVADVLGVPVEEIPGVGPIASHLLRSYAAGRALTVLASRRTAALLSEAAVGSAKVGAFAVGRGPLGRAARAILNNPFPQIQRLAAQALKAREFIGKRTRKAIKAMAKPGRIAPLVVATVDTFANTQFHPQKDKDKDVAKARINEVRRAMANPTALRALLEERLSPIMAANLDVGNGAIDLIMRKIQFLQSKLPPVSEYFTENLPMSKAAISEWARYVRAAENPMTVLDDMASRSLTPEAVEAIEVLYPRMFSEIQQTLLDQALDLRKTMPYQGRLQLTLLFKVPIEPTASPAVTQTIQAVHAAKKQQPQGGIQPAQGVADAPADPTPGQRIADR